MIHETFYLKMYDPTTNIEVDDWSFDAVFSNRLDALKYEREVIEKNNEYNKTHVLRIELIDVHETEETA